MMENWIKSKGTSPQLLCILWKFGDFYIPRIRGFRTFSAPDPREKFDDSLEQKTSWIAITTFTNLLGVTLDSQLSLEKHIENIVKTMNRWNIMYKEDVPLFLPLPLEC